MREKRREPEVPEESPSGRMFRLPCKDYLTRTCTNSFCEKCTLQNACSTSPRVVADLGEKCSYAHRQVDEQPSKMSKKNGDKSAVAMLKKHEPYDRTARPVVCDSSNTRQLGCVFQDMETPKSSSILRKSSDMQKPIRRVKLTKAVAHHADIRDQNPSIGLICPGEPHQPSPNAPKFEDRSQEETEWQKQGAREAAWKLAKSVKKLKRARKSNILLTFGKKGACLHQILNLRNDNLLSTPERRRISSAKKA